MSEAESFFDKTGMSFEIGELAKALSKAQAVMTPAIKDAKNPFFKSSYADLTSVWEAIRKPLTENGLAVVQQTGGTHEVVSVTTILVHSSGQWMKSTIHMKPTKSDPQGIGSCLTYARRYGLSAMVGVSAEDDDGNEASKIRPQTIQPAPKHEFKPTAEDEERKIQIFNQLIGKGGKFQGNVPTAKAWIQHKAHKTYEQLNAMDCEELMAELEREHLDTELPLAAPPKATPKPKP